MVVMMVVRVFAIVVSIGLVVMINPNPPDHPLSVVGVELDPVVKAAESASLLRTATHPGENNRSV